MAQVRSPGGGIQRVPISDCAVTSPDFLNAYDGITQASQELLPEVGFG